VNGQEWEEDKKEQEDGSAAGSSSGAFKRDDVAFGATGAAGGRGVAAGLPLVATGFAEHVAVPDHFGLLQLSCGGGFLLFATVTLFLLAEFFLAHLIFFALALSFSS
jgi:hypothetical protein